MAQPDGFSPQFPGNVVAKGFISTLVPVNGTLIRFMKHNTVTVKTNGTSEVDVFAATNPISGTFLGARILNKDDANGNITLQHTSAGTTVFTIAKGSQGVIKGSVFAATAFASGATATVKSSAAAANADVEIDFISSDPRLPGAQ